MIALTLAQMRTNVGRLLAAGLAIAISAAFVAATLLASGLLTHTTHDAFAASLAEADLIVAGNDVPVGTVATVAGVPGVEVAEAPVTDHVELLAGARVTWVSTGAVPSDPRLTAHEISEGTWPSEGEVVLVTSVAQRLGVAVGDTVTASHSVWDPVATSLGGEPGIWTREHQPLRVSGIVTAPGGMSSSSAQALLARVDAERFQAAQAPPEGGQRPLEHVLVVAEPGQPVAAVQAAVSDAVAADGLSVVTREEYAAARVDEFAGENNVLTGLVLGFAAIALIVASLVITNTFAVLIAQRTRSLALLRCVGATRKQLRRSVALEASVLGLASSAIGIIGGVGLAQLALTIGRAVATGVSLPATISVTPAVVLVPLIAGTAVTLLAALSPARAAGRVAPMAAMRPAAAPSPRAPSSRRRLAFSVLLTTGGFAGLAVGMYAATAVDPTVGLALGMLGGLLSIVGVLVGAVFWIPRLIGIAGAVLGRFGGPASRLAAANSVRNPRRAAATTSALLIGVTLVAMMSTGAATALASFDQELDQVYPIDVTVASLAQTAAGTPAPLDPAAIDGVSQVDGVDAVAELVRIDTFVTGSEQGVSVTALAADPAAADVLVRDGAQVAGFDAGTAIVSTAVADAAGISDGQAVTIAAVGDDVEPGSDAGVQVTARVSDLRGADILVSSAVGDQLAPVTGATDLWVRLADHHDPAAVLDGLQDVLIEHPVAVVGSAAERAELQQLIDTLLSVVVGLLGVAVVIALVGVANTLALSVIERRRESATLRAIGLTRRQLRRTLAVEGMLIAGSGAIVGSVLGTVYGWAGARTVLGELGGTVPLTVAWRDLALVLVVAVLAGLAASVLPGRRAANTPPVAALAAE